MILRFANVIRLYLIVVVPFPLPEAMNCEQNLLFSGTTKYMPGYNARSDRILVEQKGITLSLKTPTRRAEAK